MLFELRELLKIWKIDPNCVLHVGAHEAEESISYENNGWIPIVWIEGQVNLAKKLKKKLNPEIHLVLQGFIYSRDYQVMRFNVASNSQSSSLLEFGSHSIDYPEIEITDTVEIKTVRLDTLISKSKAGMEYISKGKIFLNLDIQGSELDALRSMGVLLEKIDYIYTEVNKREVYRDCAKVEEIDAFLNKFGFIRVETRWIFGKGWGDALYLKKNQLNRVAVSNFSILQESRIFIRRAVWNSKQIYQVVKTSVYSCLFKSSI